MAEINLPHEWRPRPYQEAPWRYLVEGGKRLVMRWHRRAGKDDLLLHFTCFAAHRRKGGYWYMLPEYSQARKSMWTAINPHSGKRRIDEVFPVELRRRTLDQEMMIEFHCGSTFQLVGSDNFDSLVGSPPVGLVFSEYALSSPSAWSYLRPILLENGGWAAFNSTPRGANHFKNLCQLAEREPDWFYDVKTADETGVFTEDQLRNELRQMQADSGDAFGKSMWLQEYYVSFDAAIPGSIFGEWLDRIQRAGQITKVPVQPAFPVHTAWDLGRTDATAIWFFQIIGGEIHVFDYHESNLKDIPFYTNLLRTKRADGKYKFGTHWLPHDARARTLAAGGKSIQQQMVEADVGRIVIAKRLDHQDGIQAARATLPHCWFDELGTADGREVLRNYHYEWDAEKKKFTDMPLHDWCFAEGTLVLTVNGWIAIENIAKHDQVFTPCGARLILRAGIVRWTDKWVNVKGISCTAEHRFFTSRGLVEAGDVLPGEKFWTRDSWALRILGFLSAGLSFGFMDAITSATQGGRNTERQFSCIAWSMRLLREKYRRIMKCITSTTIRSITTLTTWLRFPVLNTAASTNQSLGSSVFAKFAGPSSDVIKRSVPDAALNASVQTAPAKKENGAQQPAYSLTVERDHCYFVRGDDGEAYLVANSSHGSSAFKTLSLSWKQPRKEDGPQAPIEERIAAAEKERFTFGAMKKAHFAKQRALRALN